MMANQDPIQITLFTFNQLQKWENANSFFLPNCLVDNITFPGFKVGITTNLKLYLEFGKKTYVTACLLNRDDKVETNASLGYKKDRTFNSLDELKNELLRLNKIFSNYPITYQVPK